MTAVPLEKAIWPPTTGASKLCPTSRAASTRPAQHVNLSVLLTAVRGHLVLWSMAATRKAVVCGQACSRSVLHMHGDVEACFVCAWVVIVPPIKSCIHISCANQLTMHSHDMTYKGCSMHSCDCRASMQVIACVRLATCMPVSCNLARPDHAVRPCNSFGHGVSLRVCTFTCLTVSACPGGLGGSLAVPLSCYT